MSISFRRNIFFLSVLAIAVDYSCFLTFLYHDSLSILDGITSSFGQLRLEGGVSLSSRYYSSSVASLGPVELLLSVLLLYSFLLHTPSTSQHLPFTLRPHHNTYLPFILRLHPNTYFSHSVLIPIPTLHIPSSPQHLSFTLRLHPGTHNLSLCRYLLFTHLPHSYTYSSHFVPISIPNLHISSSSRYLPFFQSPSDLCS